MRIQERFSHGGSLKSLIAATTICSLIAGCTLIPRPTANAVINLPASDDTADVHRAGVPNLPKCLIAEEGDECFNRMFIGIAISGGGARAANFGLATLLHLDNLGIYDDVTAVSSVSGGSLAAATYVFLPHETQSDVDHSIELLRTNFLSEWIGRATNPVNMIRSIGSGRNATRSLGDTFDDVLFHGARFGDMGKYAKGRPFLYINSAIINGTGGDQEYTTRAQNAPADHLQGFTFTKEAFESLSSDLGKMRIADAVAASGAYPVLFDSITLQDYSLGAGTYRRPKYLHVTDGGPADNLGTDALVEAYGKILFGNPEASCLLIAIDAHVSDRLDQYGAFADTRTGVFDFVVSPAFKRTFDLLLDRRREDQLGQLGIKLASDFPSRFVDDVAIPLGNNGFWSDGWRSGKIRSIDKNQTFARLFGSRHEFAHCAVWHIGLDRLLELSEKGGRRYRRAHYLTLNNGDRCSPRTIQQSLFSASFELTTRDRESLDGLTTWLRNHGRSRIADNIQARLNEYQKDAFMHSPFVPNYQIEDSTFSPMTKRVECRSTD